MYFPKGSYLTARHVDIVTYAATAYGSTVFRFAFTLLRSFHHAEDVYQETFLALHSSQQIFESDEHLRAWLLKVAGNRCRTIYREKQRHREDLIDPADFASMPITDGKAPSSEAPNVGGVWDIVDTLNNDQREAIYLFYIEGYSTEEIAKIVGVSNATIRTRLYRARAKIKQHLK